MPNGQYCRADFFAWLERQGEKKPVEVNKGNNGRFSHNSDWSEYDEKMLVTVLWHVSNSISNGKEIYVKCDTIDWLNKLRERVCPQTHWKPSEEMLEALYRVIPENAMDKSEDEILLDKLYQGLKYGKVLSEK